MPSDSSDADPQKRRSISLQEPTSGFRYLAFLPPGTPTSRAVVVYLHGVGERGDDLSAVKRYGLPALLARGDAATDCPVLCPQLESSESAWEPQRVLSFVRAVAVGLDHVILIGYSLGGSGVCEVVSRYGAAAQLAIAIAAQAPDQAKADQAGVTLLVVQGELDPWPRTGGFVQSVQAAGGAARSVVLPGKDHYVSEEAVAHPLALSMLRAAGVTLTLR